MIKRVLCIINPASGLDYPILAVANRFFREANIGWEPRITLTESDARRFARAARGGKYDAVVACGGDGTVTEVALALAGTGIPTLHVPVGTGNVIAKELGIMLQPPQALALLRRGEHRLVDWDVFRCNRRTLLMRVNVGVFSEGKERVSREIKDKYGLLAYVFAAFKNLTEADISTYEIEVDGRRHTTRGYGLMLANNANLGLEGVQLLPQIQPTDGLLDLVVLRDIGVGTLAKLTINTLLQNKSQELEHYRGKAIRVRMRPKQPVYFDDSAAPTATLNARILPGRVRLIAPGEAA
jgi:diacylglycerol kinase family enzyme